MRARQVLGEPVNSLIGDREKEKDGRDCTSRAALFVCRYGYSNVNQLQRVVDSYAYFKIPLETFVTDSQYFYHDQDFTVSPEFEPFNVTLSTSCRPPPVFPACSSGSSAALVQ